MKHRFTPLFPLLALVILILAACGVRAARQATIEPEMPALGFGNSVEPMATPGNFLAEPAPAVEDKVNEAAGVPAGMPTGVIYQTGGEPQDADVQNRASRMILKNAEIRL